MNMVKLLLALCISLSGCAAFYNSDKIDVTANPSDDELRAAWGRVDFRYTEPGYVQRLRAAGVNRWGDRQSWTERERDCVMAGEIKEGMNGWMVYWAWGPADRTEHHEGSSGRTDVWHYNRLHSGYLDTCVYIRDGYVTSWHTSDYR